MADSITNSLYTASFIALEGEVTRSQRTGTEITRPAADGHAYRYMGIKAPPFRLIGTRDTATYATASALIEEWRTFPMTMCSITQRGVVHPSMLCLSFVPVLKKQCAGAVGGIEDGSYLVVVEWTFQDTSIV